MTRYQGEDIEFSLTLKMLEESDLQSWRDAESVVAYFYTNPSQIAKFTTNYLSPFEEDYQALNFKSDTELVGVIGTAHTSHMNGALFCDVYVRMPNGSLEQIKRTMTGINIEYTPIKQETTF